MVQGASTRRRWRSKTDQRLHHSGAQQGRLHTSTCSELRLQVKVQLSRDQISSDPISIRHPWNLRGCSSQSLRSCDRLPTRLDPGSGFGPGETQDPRTVQSTSRCPWQRRQRSAREHSKSCWRPAPLRRAAAHLVPPADKPRRWSRGEQTSRPRASQGSTRNTWFLPPGENRRLKTSPGYDQHLWPFAL